MASPSSTVTALSAPGKVLLTGGYLVLDRSYTGTVFALDARIHVVVQQLRRRGPSGASAKEHAEVAGGNGAGEGTAAGIEGEDTIIVRSPQFVDAVWEYSVRKCENGGGIQVKQKNDG